MMGGGDPGATPHHKPPLGSPTFDVTESFCCATPRSRPERPAPVDPA